MTIFYIQFDDLASGLVSLMSISKLPLSYCSNVHPGLTVEALIQTLISMTAPIQAQVKEPLAIGLWLPQPVAESLLRHPGLLTQLATQLNQQQLLCYTLNAFPFGNFHQARVKENVYLPDWTTPERLDYTQACARLLASLLPDGIEGSISTLPLGFKRLAQDSSFLSQTFPSFIQLATFLDELHDSTGKVIRIAVEPEPLCLLETTDEAIQWYQQLLSVAGKSGNSDIVQRHIGLCLDICHQAVEFESLADSIQKITQSGLRINKVHLSSALHIDAPCHHPEAIEDLKKFSEPRYLHQIVMQKSDGSVERMEDLDSESLELISQPDVLAARIHFHVPVHQTHLGHLGTTQSDLNVALNSIAQLEYAPHLEIETYTWSVITTADPLAIINGIASEFVHIHSQLKKLVPASDGKLPLL